MKAFQGTSTASHLALHSQDQENDRMILSVLVINNSGKPRLSKFFSPECTATHVRTQLVSKIYSAIQDRPDALCNFVDLPASDGLSQPARIVYRHYATLYFIFLVDEAESELGILDLIQVSLNRPALLSNAH